MVYSFGSKSKPQSLPTCNRCGAHEGRAFGRGFTDGIRLLRDALKRGDIAEAQRIIDLAEKRIAQRWRR